MPRIESKRVIEIINNKEFKKFFKTEKIDEKTNEKKEVQDLESVFAYSTSNSFFYPNFKIIINDIQITNSFKKSSLENSLKNYKTDEDTKIERSKILEGLFRGILMMILNDQSDKKEYVHGGKTFTLSKFNYKRSDLKKFMSSFDCKSLEESKLKVNDINFIIENYPSDSKIDFKSLQYDEQWKVIDSYDVIYEKTISELNAGGCQLSEEKFREIFQKFDKDYLWESCNATKLKDLKKLINHISEKHSHLNIDLNLNLELAITKKSHKTKGDVKPQISDVITPISASYKKSWKKSMFMTTLVFIICVLVCIGLNSLLGEKDVLLETPVVQGSTRNTIDTSLITTGRTKINEINCEEKSETDNVNYLTIYALDGVYDNQTHEIGVRLKNKLQEIIKNNDLNFKILFCNKYRTVSYHNKSHLSNKISNLESKTDFEFYHEYNQGSIGGSVITIHNKPRYYPNEPLVSEDFSAFKYSFIKTSRQANKINITSDIIDERKLEYMAYYFLAHYYDLHLFDKKVYDIHSLKYFKLLIGEIKNKSKNSFTIHDIEQILKYKHNNPQLLLKALTKYYQNTYYREIDIKKFNSLIKKTLENDHFLNIKNINRCVLISINAFTYQENKELFDFLLRFMSTTYFQFYEDEPALSNLSNLHTSLYVHCNYLEKGREQLYGNLLQFKEETPKNIVYLNIAYLYYLESKYDQAIDVLKISIHDDNTSFECKRKNLMLSKLYGLIGKPNKSFEYTNLAYKYERPLKSHEEIRELYLNLYNINSYDIYHMSCVYSQKDPFSREALDLINWAIAEQNFSLRGEKSLYINKYFLEQRRRVLKYRNDNGYKVDSLKTLSLDKFFFKKDSNELIPSFMYEPKPLFYMNNLDGSRFIHNLPKASYHLGLRHYLKFHEYSQL